MKIFYCDDRFEDMMTCIYDAWCYALKEGHDNVRLTRQRDSQENMFDEYVYVTADKDKVVKVTRSIERDISRYAFMQVFYATLSNEEDALDAIYRFLIIGFKVGERVSQMLNDAAVMRMMEIKRKVGNEAHFFREFVRFSSIKLNSKNASNSYEEYYIAHIEPKCNIVNLLGNHFADRMPSENWCIVDDNRKYAVIHPKDEEYYFQYLTDREYDILHQSEEYEDEYTSLWKTFFNAIGIKERANYRCQRNMIPIWMRKHAVEFME